MTNPNKPLPEPRTGRPARGGAGEQRTPIQVVPELMERDLRLLRILDEHQVLTADQIARLAFPSLDRAYQRVRQLTDRGVLTRFRAAVRPGSQAWRYTLGLSGAALLAAERAQPPPRQADHDLRVLRLARSPRLNHLLGINEFFVTLAHHARTHQHAENVDGRSDLTGWERLALYRWLNERRATELCAGLARPDGFGTWALRYEPSRPGGNPRASGASGRVREVSYFLEYDTGTEPLPQLIDKLPGYAEARLGGGPDHPVLFWLPSIIRETQLHQRLAQQVTPVAVATASAQMATAAGHGPAGPVWLIAGEQRRRRLIELPGRTYNQSYGQPEAA